MSVFGRSVTPKRQPAEFEDRVAELVASGMDQDAALEQAAEEMPGAW